MFSSDHQQPIRAFVVFVLIFASECRYAVVIYVNDVNLNVLYTNKKMNILMFLLFWY